MPNFLQDEKAAEFFQNLTESEKALALNVMEACAQVCESRAASLSVFDPARREANKCASSIRGGWSTKLVHMTSETK